MHFASGAIVKVRAAQHNQAMKKKPLKDRPLLGRNYIREWREFRNLSLDRLVDRMSDPAADEPFITKTSLSRIERSLQPYSQPLLEAIAAALDCQPADLIMRNPQETEAPWSIWESLQPAQREQAIQMLRVIQGTSDKAA